MKNPPYLIRAIVLKDIDKLNKIKKNKYILDDFILNCAILTNNIQVVQIIIEMGAKPSYLTLDYAIFVQNIIIINMVLEIGAKPSNYTLVEALNTNNLEIILFIIKKFNFNVNDIKNINFIGKDKFYDKIENYLKSNL